MAGVMRKTMVYLGLADSDEQFEAEPQNARTEHVRTEEDKPVHTEREERRQALATREPAAAEVEEYRAPVTPIKRAAAVREDSGLRQITTVHPRSYNDAKVIGESFRDGIPVIMNVTDMGEADAKRLVDFSAGLVFGLHGSIERVTNKVFLLTPASIEVLGEDKKVSDGQAAFFNQS
ncbi:cell division protein SepF [Sinomonas terrae]|uniref:Cell division protein SepF n=1 Tax=Sinomonas terrae TaxID=2908838 RepID=A0ABS9U216_9MICC|nr:cell division protein SepF [Sinomonas terrae]MCH6470625.1 cell division protein SepF [Sinomonas terrae]